MTGRKKWRGLLWILPSFTGMMIFYCVPYMDVLKRSVTKSPDGSFAGIENFKEIFQNPAFLLAAQNTVKFTAVCIPVLTALSLILAVAVMRCRFGHVYKWIFLLPMALPAVSAALVWKLLFHNNGIINAVLNSMNIGTADWLNTSAAFWVMVISYLWRNIGYDMILWMAGLRQIESSIYEAARIDGADEVRIFFCITIPNLKNVIYIAAVLSLLNSFKVFREAYLVAGNYPDDSMYMIQHLFNNWFRALAIDKMSAASVMVGIVVLILIFLLYKAWGKEIV